jgi:hypothetical protein
MFERNLPAVAILLAYGLIFGNYAKASDLAVGDMQYWDGTQWARIPVITAPKGVTPKLTLCKGVPTWVLNKCFTKGPYQIGDLGPARGIVFYLSDSNGFHGLEAAPDDQSSNSQWGCYNNSAPIVTGAAIGTGASNTTNIIAGCNKSESGVAAKIASDYEFDGFTDWYLPSLNELNEMLTSIGPGAPAPVSDMGGFSSAPYWSSTGAGASIAKGASFSNGTVRSYSFPTNTPMYVRAIRAF